MGSVVPFQDLNLYPHSSTAMAATSGTGGVLLVPKIEPKTEPFDEPPLLENHFGMPSFLSTPNPNPNLNPNTGPGSDMAPTLQPNTPNSGAVDNSAGGSAGGADLYSEYHRISELFRFAFAHKMRHHGDIDVLDDPDSRAIVPISSQSDISCVTQENQLATHVNQPRRYHQRSSELVRVTDLKPEDQRYFRDVVRRTRMVYDSLRIFTVAEDELVRLYSPRDPNRRSWRARGDLRAAQLMRDRGLWLNRDKRIVGAIPGVHIGDVFFFRMELCVVGLHGQTQAGIDYVSASQSSNGEPIATSVIVSGGYEDDEDAGDVVIYTGHGGQDKNGRQVMSQKLECGNLALERSMYYGIEVRVIRGFRYDGSPCGKVYVYDGLYKVANYWCDVGKSGFGVFKFKLVRMENQPEMGTSILKFAQNLRARPLEVRPKGYISMDISKKKENVPVLFYNDIDNNHEPVFYDYLVTAIFPQYVYHHSGNGTGCDCVGGCLNDCFCVMKNGGELAYDQNGCLIRGKPLVFECGPHCRCPASCRNRVTQKGVKYRFEVFRSRETGWGVRSLDLIQAGSFICEYAGLILTQEQAQLFTMNGDGLVHPGRFTDRWTEWGDLSQVYPHYAQPTYPSIPPLDFAMDVSRMRNIACYMSHSTSPNVVVQPVLYDHNNVSFPHLMLFASENIPPLRELSLDYGVADECTGKLAICN